MVNKENFIVIKTSIDGLQQAISLKDPQCQWRKWIAAMLGEMSNLSLGFFSLKPLVEAWGCRYIMRKRRQKWHALIEENNKIDTLWYTLEASLLAWYSFLLVCCLNNSLFDGLSFKKAQFILETSSFTPSLAKKNSRVLLPEMRLDRV
jgi:hypothetical protein